MVKKATRRGRKPRETKTSSVTIRVEPDLLAALNIAKEHSGRRTLSGEIHWRLRNSFLTATGRQNKKNVATNLASALARAMATASAEDVENDGSWISDWFAHQTFKVGMLSIIEHFKPDMQPYIPKTAIDAATIMFDEEDLTPERAAYAVGRIYALLARGDMPTKRLDPDDDKTIGLFMKKSIKSPEDVK